MSDTATVSNNLLPQRTTTNGGAKRRIGVEIELAGLNADIIADKICQHFGGEIQANTKLEYIIANSRLGDFRVELDASYIKALAERQLEFVENDNKFANTMVDYLTKAAEQMVPWEIVSPPIDISQLASLEALVDDLRAAGGKGTRWALHYAFGVHFNPELPSLDNPTILSYLRAYFCLYDWIVFREQTDTTRKLTTYIRHFPKAYISLLLDQNYQPDQTQLIADYLQFNPTRNRSLDMLPLFAHLNEQQVLQTVDDPRIKARPTFHYRLPNCDIDNPSWNLHIPWRLWLQVENLANHPNKLRELCERYSAELARLTHAVEGRWAQNTQSILDAWHWQ